MNISKILYIVIAIILLQVMIIAVIIKKKQDGGLKDVSITKHDILHLKPINLGEIAVPLPIINKDDDVTAKFKLVIYIVEIKGMEVKEFENIYNPKLREIAARIVKKTPYVKLRNVIEEQDALKVLMRTAMNKEIGSDVVKEIVFDGTIVFE